MKCSKYEDCQSCAFDGQNSPICDVCEDADQWEQGYEDALGGDPISLDRLYEKVAA